MSTSVKRPIGHHHGDLRNALLGAALDLVTERGPHGFTFADASRHAGVSVAAPYKHFADREALLAALAETGYAEQRRRFAEAVAAASDAADQLAAFASAYVRFAQERRPLFQVMFGAGLTKDRYPELASAADRVLEVLREPAEALRSSPQEATNLMHVVAASSHGFAGFLLEGVFGPSASVVDSTCSQAAAAARALVGPASIRLW
ncbi:TetR/AcrR family transcriptional regulator [Plantibacter sp. Mn2098]|uniref:TetR/AcrR family transcriptional regulator n=1 Tax=Plantibacter sp. Mn2098 TaxID=3395266 RepID=UPI003BD22309